MSRAQAGILGDPGAHHRFLEYRLRGDARGAARVLASAAGDAGDGAALVVAFDCALYRGLRPGAAGEPFRELAGANHRFPETQRDLFVWVHDDEPGAVFDRARAVDRALRASADLELEVHGFRYHDSRDLSGFIDGSANPKGDAARAAAFVPEGDEAGGSFVLTQRWIHDLDAFEALDVADQERVIGRTKPDSVEFEGDAMPEDAHVARNDVSSAKILRRSAPYGGAREHGLYFLAFACEQARFDLLLRRMLGLDASGPSDRLLEFSRAVTGSYWFAPSREALASLA